MKGKKAKVARRRARQAKAAPVKITVAQPALPPVTLVVPPSVLKRPTFWQQVAKFFTVEGS